MGSHPCSRVPTPPHCKRSLRPMGRRIFRVRVTTARRKRSQKANPRAPRTESLAAEGKAARPSPPSPRTMARAAGNIRQQGEGGQAWASALGGGRRERAGTVLSSTTTPRFEGGRARCDPGGRRKPSRRHRVFRQYAVIFFHVIRSGGGDGDVPATENS